MIIAGLQKTTLLDYPSHVAATIFLGGCNFRCPFCHNMNIVDYNSLENRTNMKDLVNERDFYSKEDIFDFLKKRASVLEGICITGGEPTINSDLKEFIIEIREVVKQVSNADRFLIKLDTNGSNPKLLKSLIDDGLIDYVAMDIKSSREKYLAAAGVTGEIIDNICESINILIHSNI